MLKENEFIRDIKKRKDINDQEEWHFRQYFRSLPDHQKSEREYIKSKNGLTFSEWWDLIGENIDEGQLVHEMNFRDSRKLGSQHDKLRKQINDPEYRKYLGLDPLTDEEMESIRETFKDNTDGMYNYPDLSYLDEEEDEEEEEIVGNLTKDDYAKIEEGLNEEE